MMIFSSLKLVFDKHRVETWCFESFANVQLTFRSIVRDYSMLHKENFVFHLVFSNHEQNVSKSERFLSKSFHKHLFVDRDFEDHSTLNQIVEQLHLNDKKLIYFRQCWSSIVGKFRLDLIRFVYEEREWEKKTNRIWRIDRFTSKLTSKRQKRSNRFYWCEVGPKIEVVWSMFQVTHEPKGTSKIDEN